MRAEGTRHVRAHRGRVWTELHDADVLHQALPACQSIRGNAQQGFTADFAHKIGPLPLSVTCRITFADEVPEEALRLTITGRNILALGASCHIDMRLAPDGDETIISYVVTLRLNAALRRAVGEKVEQGMDRIAAHIVERFAGVIEARAAG